MNPTQTVTAVTADDLAIAAAQIIQNDANFAVVKAQYNKRTNQLLAQKEKIETALAEPTV